MQGKPDPPDDEFMSPSYDNHHAMARLSGYCGQALASDGGKGDMKYALFTFYLAMIATSPWHSAQSLSGRPQRGRVPCRITMAVIGRGADARALGVSPSDAWFIACFGVARRHPA
jgi:hypothetical protein